ncbi:MAG: bifunctional 4-hydroxy-2-oxoglutarate aldolase/2-dehydro-3-deoxy-phosphogluconate aldolase [Clostridia bacterium]|nr:bifunctional 4-hydroxy-2-oxoglutarate aldolase/2-dehydro-3-deoxy-phosphogluconate aldolase [Clostridia bacterium]
MENILTLIRKTGIVPVVVIEDAKDAEPLAKALCEGGLPCAEVTFRTDAAEEAIGIITKKYPDMLIGAGTVLTPDQVDRAVAAGAGFMVSPGLNPTTVKYCQSKGVPIIPGIQTPSEIELALSLGLDTLKFFPAEPAGGLEMIKAIAAPYTGVTFMPTGGINIGNVSQYLAYDRIIACGGSWMVKKDLISSGDFDTIREMTAVAAGIVKEVRGD